MELEILLARAQALALHRNGQDEEAETHIRRALELGSQRGEEHILVDLRLGSQDYAGARQLLVEFRERLTPEKARFYEAVSLALEGRVSTEIAVCWEELPDQESFGRAILAHAMEHADATRFIQEALEAKPSAWKQRKLEALLLQHEGVSVCCLCKQVPAARLWGGEKPLCIACAEYLDEPSTFLRVFAGKPSPESLRLAAWLEEMAEPEELKEIQELYSDLPSGDWVDGDYQLDTPDRPSNGILQVLSEQQLLAALPPDFRNKLVRPLSLAQLALALMKEPSAEVVSWLPQEQFSDIIEEAQSWPTLESAAFWNLQTAQWRSKLDSQAPDGEIDLAALWEVLQLQAPEQSGLARNCSSVCGMVSMSADGLGAEDITLLESLLEDHPSDLFLRSLLTRAYALGDPRKSQMELWFTRHRPRLGAIGHPHTPNPLNPKFEAAAVQAWAEHILANPGDTTILGPAAEFFSWGNRDLAIALYSRCLELEPEEPEWYRKLANAIRRSSSARETKTRALELMEQSLELEKEECFRQHLRTEMVRLAVEAGEDQKARRWAEELIQQAHTYDFEGDALHQGHLALGFLALKAGHITEAESHLLKAGQVPTTPVLGSFGPSMHLAQQLLKQGSSQAVLDYLETCKTFWKSGSRDQWVEAIQRGDMPEFGSNLNY